VGNVGHPGPPRALVPVSAADVSPGSLRAQAEVRKDDLSLGARRPRLRVGSRGRWRATAWVTRGP